MLSRVRELFFQTDRPKLPSVTDEPRLLVGKLCTTGEARAVQVDFAGRSLRLYPDSPLDGRRQATKDWILVDGERYLNEVCGFLRIARGESLRVGRGDQASHRLFRFPKGVMRREFEIANDDGRITITQLDPGGETHVRYVDDAEGTDRLVASRIASLETVRRIFGGPIEMLPPAQALATLRTVNEILRDEAYRPRDALGRPGGLLRMPDEVSPVIVGDLHANLDNLLKVLSENACLESLERGDASLIILGDAVHPQADGALTQMDTSLLMLDLIFMLKIRFPRNVFYVRGNHDSFDDMVSKGGILQGVMLRNRARKLRGRQYVEALAEFFESLPYVVRASDYVACHGGPPRGEASLADLVNIRSHPRLASEILWNRVRRPGHPGGYAKRHVRAFRETLSVNEQAPVVVGHTPLSAEETLWLDVGKIQNHHIVYSANAHSLSVFVRAGGDLVPLEYPAEGLLDLTNSLSIAEQDHSALVG